MALLCHATQRLAEQVGKVGKRSQNEKETMAKEEEDEVSKEDA